MLNPIFQQGEELLLNPFGSKYLGVAAHTNVNSNEFIVQEDAVISVLTGGDSSTAANNVDYKVSMSLSGVTLKQGALIVAPQGESFQSITIDSGTIMAYNSVVGGTKPSAVQLLLDLYPDAAAAYSLRKLRTDYTGPAIEARKTVGGVTSVQDIGFVDNELDTASLLTFANGGDVSVAKWYDQSTNGFNVFNNAESAQPKIVIGGVLQTESSKPCINLSANPNYFLRNDFGSSSVIQKTLIIVGKQTTASDQFGAMVTSFDDTPNNPIFTGRNGNNYSSFAAGVDIVDAWPTYENQYLLHFSAADVVGNGQWHVNSNLAGTATTTTGYNGITIGRTRNLSHYAAGTIQEVILYPTDQSANRAVIEDNINTHYTIY